ncbi:MAG TPA: DNA recombination protein RmuC, partial [Firmicutes bacterium]|nr:DNA recombination protein RmuC [Bacillota bacterium]
MEVYYFLAGLLLGLGLALFVFSRKEKEADRLKKELELQARDSFSRLSLEALERNNRAFISLAVETLSHQAKLGAKELEGKKALIDLGIENMSKDIYRLKDLVVSLEKERESRYGELAQQLRQTAEETASLRETTAALKKVLSDSQARGRWGEKMAEDILRLAGLLEGINYVKQKTGETGTRPDFTFFLPKGLKINMDVKFPLDNYVAFLEAKTDAEKEKYRNKFIKDARARVKEIANRNYVNPAEKTLDYAIMFIPNEQVFAFINSEDREFMDYSLKNKVMACSPLT